MLDKFKNLPLRKGVGIILLNSENKVFVARRIDNPKNFWQMPQGGVDKNEDFLTAALRELKEETNIENVELIEIAQAFSAFHTQPQVLNMACLWSRQHCMFVVSCESI